MALGTFTGVGVVNGHPTYSESTTGRFKVALELLFEKRITNKEGRNETIRSCLLPARGYDHVADALEDWDIRPGERLWVVGELDEKEDAFELLLKGVEIKTHRNGR